MKRNRYTVLWFENINSADLATTVEMDVKFGDTLIKGAFETGDFGGDAEEIDASVFTQKAKITIPGQTEQPNFTVQFRLNDTDMKFLREKEKTGGEAELTTNFQIGSQMKCKAILSSVYVTGMSLNSPVNATGTFQITEPWEYLTKDEVAAD